MFSNRGMYKDGWEAASVAFEPWQATRTGYDPMKAKWELCNLDENLSQANDVAPFNPEKVKEMEALW